MLAKEPPNDGTESAMYSRTEPIRRRGLCLIAAIAFAAAACSRSGSDESSAATTPPSTLPPPAASPPPAAPPDDAAEPQASCWEALDEIDDDIGCLRVSFDVAAGDPEIYEAYLVYPDELEFDGFSVAGPAGTVVGTMDLDLMLDDVVEPTVLFMSLNDGSAYADVLPDTAYSPDFEPIFGHVSGNEFLLRLPYGGDVDPRTFFVPTAARITLTLRTDLMTASTSSSGSSFTVTGSLTSVDPETDNHDDGLGAAPTVTPFTAEVSIAE